MSSICKLLFAYGTLLTGDTSVMGRAHRARLAAQSRVVGPAWTSGRLYNLGDYPGLVASETAREMVHGEVVELIDPAGTLAWLDDYEGIVPGEHAHADYARVQRPVMLQTGERLSAWVYVWQKPVSAAALMTGGRWLER